MKRYEERLLEDMQSHRWKILLSDRPLIYSLPNELLILIFEFIDTVGTLRDVRSVSRRFAQLATTMIFKTIYMDSVKPSRMPLLAWVFSKNPPLLQAATAIHLRLCGLRLTWSFPSRLATTRDQDVAQAQVISAMPNLRSLSICLGQILSEAYPSAANTPRLGFTRTLEALSKSLGIRELHVSEVSNMHATDMASFLLFDLFTNVGQRLEQLHLQRHALDLVLELFGPANPIEDAKLLRSPPVFSSLTCLSLQFQYLGTPEFNKLAVMLSRHMPKLKTLVCATTEPKHCWLIDETTHAMPTMPPIQRLFIRECHSLRRWMISVPTKRVEFRFVEWYQCVILQELASAIIAQEGVFRQGYVGDIHLTILDSPSGRTEQRYTVYPIYGLQGMSARPMVERMTPEAALQLLKQACDKSKIALTTSFTDEDL